MQHSMLRPLALGSPTPSRTWLGYKQSTCRGLGTAPPLLSPACARGPARSLADPRGTRLPPWHRKKMSGRCIVEDDDDLAPRRGPNSDILATASPRRTAAVVETSAAPTIFSTIRSASRPVRLYSKEQLHLGLSAHRTGGGQRDQGSPVGESPSLEDGPGAGLSYVVLP